MNEKRPLIALDGDEAVLRAIAQVGSPYYVVHVTRDPRMFLSWLEQFADVAVVATEHVLQTSSGVALLETARTMRPRARRVLMTSYHDLASIVGGLHSGAIERLVSKPFSHAELLNAVLPEELKTMQSHRAAG